MMLSSKKYNRLFLAILLSQIVVLADLVVFLSDMPDMLPYDLFKYAAMILSGFFVLSYSVSNRQRLNAFQAMLLIWILGILLFAIPSIISPTRNYINLKLFASNYFFLYMIPFIMMASPSMEVYKKVMKLAFGLSLLYIVVAIIVWITYGEIMSYPSEATTVLLEGGVLLIMTYPYHSKKKMLYVIIALVLGIGLMMVLSRRNRVVYFGGGFVLAMLLIELKSKLSFGYKVALSILLIILASVVYSATMFGEFFDKVSTGMSSREHVIEMFEDDFNRTPSDWIWGRGMYGNYDGGMNNDEITGYREGIENGYLQLILKGGAIWLGLLTIVSLVSVYKGLFKSKNLLCKGFALIILLYYIDMIGFGVPTISLKYIMVYLAIGGCNSKWLRNCSDNYISQQIGIK